MNVLRLVIAIIVSALWIGGYLAAYFVDPRLGDLAQGTTPVMLIVVGFLFGQGARELLRKETG